MLSFAENIPIILREVDRLQPKKILDVGAGMGKYGLLIREQYLSDKAAKGELEPTDDIIIHALEDTKYLLTERLCAIYNCTIEGDVFQCGEIFEKEKYDLVLMIDTVEHWEKDKTLDLIGRIVKHSAVIISTPKRTKMYTKHFYGDSRHHITQWTEADFINNFNGVRMVPSPFSYIAIILHENN